MKQRRSDNSSPDISLLIKDFYDFACPQVAVAFYSTVKIPVTLREKVIYFVFFDHAATKIILQGEAVKSVDRDEVDRFLTNSFFGKEGIAKHVGIADADVLVASKLKSKGNIEIIQIKRACQVALNKFVGDPEGYVSEKVNSESFAHNALKKLIEDDSLLSGVNEKYNSIEDSGDSDSATLSVQRNRDGEKLQNPNLGAWSLAHILPPCAYLAGAVALYNGAGSMKWWIAGLIFATWFSRVGILTAIRGHPGGAFPPSYAVFTLVLHWICLIALFACELIAFFG
jgi:hypothetical protein